MSDPISFPVFISGGINNNAPMTGYVVPTGTKTYIKSITVINETSGSGYVSFWAKDIPNRTNIVNYIAPILTSGYIPSYGRLKVLDDFIVIDQTGKIIITTNAPSVNYFTAHFSIIEKPMFPNPPRLEVATNHYSMTGSNFFYTYTPEEPKIKGIIKSITLVNTTNQSGYIDLSWQTMAGLGSSSNEYQIIRSGYVGPYGRLRCLEDILITQNITNIPFGGDWILGRTETSTSGIFNLMITSVEEPLELEI